MPLTVTPNKNRRRRGRNGSAQTSPVLQGNPAESPEGPRKTSPRAYSPKNSNMVDTLPVLTGTPSNNKAKEVLIRPRTVTPLSTYRGPADSWEDYGEGFFGAANRARRNMEQGTPTPSRSSPPEALHYPIKTSFDEDDMPMDELMDTVKLPQKTAVEECAKPSSLSIEPMESPSISNSPGGSNVGKITLALESNSMDRPDGLTLEERMLWDSIQSTVINATKRTKVDTASSNNTRETNLEMKLHESETRIEQLNQKLRLANVEDNVAAASEASTKKINQLEEQLRDADSELKRKESEHDAELRAIQRVLAEMTTEREEETQVLNETVASLSEKVETLQKENAELQKQNVPPPPPPPPPPSKKEKPDTTVEHPASQRHEEETKQLKSTVRELEAEQQANKKEIDRKSRRVMMLERDYKALKAQLKKVEDEKRALENGQGDDGSETPKAEIERLRDSNQKLQSELDAANKERKTRRKTLGSMTPPRPDTTSHTDVESVSSSMSAEDVESLQKNLSETTSSLENAKKIIASLENANGSMAVDLRAKLKSKEEELANVQNESAERKRRLDSLATELRDLQKKHDDIERLETQNKTQIIRHKALMSVLEKSISGLQAASAVHEVSTANGAPDQSNVDQISEIINDTMVGIRTSLELSENFMDEYDDASTVAFTDVDMSSDVGRQIDAIVKNDREALAKNVKDELEEKKLAVRRLEEALQKQTEELRRLRFEQKSSDDNKQLMAEIQSLREQCSNNMEVLAQKERELSVLRSTLKVDENDAGYISDDASDGDDEKDADLSSGRLSAYDPEQSGALATLLAAGGNMPSQESDLQQELVKAIGEKEKAAKELKDERESLANAKLIISSLEKANKSMMEDLRSRLQDSNSAIASLLDKSAEHENNSNTLREEVEKLRKEKERLENQIQKETPKLQKATETSCDVSFEEKKEDTLEEETAATA